MNSAGIDKMLQYTDCCSMSTLQREVTKEVTQPSLPESQVESRQKISRQNKSRQKNNHGKQDRRLVYFKTEDASWISREDAHYEESNSSCKIQVMQVIA